MELKLMNVFKQALQIIGLAVVVFCLLNGAVDFWSRHRMAGELVSLMQTRYVYEADEPESRISNRKR